MCNCVLPVLYAFFITVSNGGCAPLVLLMHGTITMQQGQVLLNLERLAKKMISYYCFINIHVQHILPKLNQSNSILLLCIV